jgi:hypothetical protein
MARFRAPRAQIRPIAFASGVIATGRFVHIVWQHRAFLLVNPAGSERQTFVPPAPTCPILPA